MKEGGVITIEIEGMSFEKCERYREIIHILIASGSLDIPYGRTVLHWENRMLMMVDGQPTLWKRGKSPPLPNAGEHASVEILPKKTAAPPQTTSGQP